MDLNVFGAVHWIYLVITLLMSAVGLFCAKKFAKTEKSQKIVIFWIFLHPSTCGAKHDKRPKIPPLQNLSKDEIDKLVREYI